MTRPAAIAYVRASSREQEIEGLTLPEQKGRLAEEAERRGYELRRIVADTASGKKMDKRELPAILDALDRGEYDVLLVTRLDRIARSLIDFLPVLERSADLRTHAWQLVMLDPAVDTTTPYGRAMAQMGGVFAELEGALISQRTREGLAYARARGTFRPGEHSRYSDRAVISRITRWSTQGKSAGEIAGRLELEGTPCPRRALLIDGILAAEAAGELEHGAELRATLDATPNVWHPKTINRIINREGRR